MIPEPITILTGTVRCVNGRFADVCVEGYHPLIVPDWAFDIPPQVYNKVRLVYQDGTVRAFIISQRIEKRIDWKECGF
jgi:hypothetical protein